MHDFLQYLLHIDDHIGELIVRFGPQAYAILFAVVFAETGLVVTPFLPGDTLLFFVGLFCHPHSSGNLSLPLAFVVLMAAAFCGDNVNYWVGRTVGGRLFRNEESKVFKKSHLEKTQHFFEKHGPKTVMLARFVPIVRTFTPFVAGMGHMPYRQFLMYSVLGALLWVGLFLFGGYLLGEVPVVRENVVVTTLVMAAVTALPMVLEIVKARRKGEI